MTLALRFEDGTVRIEVEEPSALADADLPGVEVDPRSGVARAPAIAYADLRAELDDRGVAYDDRVLPDETLDLRTGYDLREYQRDALAAWLRGDADRRGVLELPTGSGKTVIAVAAMAELGVPTLVVVPTVDLLDQWHRELATEFDVPVGRFGGGEQRREPITVSTYDSAYLRAEEVGGAFGFVVFDEVHHLGGEGYRDVARLLAAPARLGLTATFERPDGAHEAVVDLVGPRVYALDAADLAGEHLAEYEIRRIEVALTDEERERYEAAQGTFVDYLRSSDLDLDSGSDYRKLVMRSGNDPAAREALLAKQRARDVMMNAERKLDELARLFERHRGDRIIVFAAHTDLVYRISEQFLVPAITGETGAAERRDVLERFRDGEYGRIVAANVLDEGVDVPDANVGIVLSGSGSRREFTQRLGRLLRPSGAGSETEMRAESDADAADPDSDASAGVGSATLYELVSTETAEERVARRRR